MVKVVRSIVLISVLLMPQIVVPSESIRLRAAVAANFATAMRDIAKQYQRESGVEIEIISGASGKFYAQILQGAPYDLFFSADQLKPLALEKAGLSLPDSRMTYAVGSLVLWSPSEAMDVEGATCVLSAACLPLAIANPSLAPYGLAAQQALTRLSVDVSKSSLVRGENIAQTFQFVHSGAAQAGFIAASQWYAMVPKVGVVWPVPKALHEPIRQDAVIIRRSTKREQAEAFLHYLRTPSVADILQRYGYREFIE